MKENSRKGFSICLILVLFLAFLASVATVDAASQKSCKEGTFCTKCVKDSKSDIIDTETFDRCRAICKYWNGDEMDYVYAVFEKDCDTRFKQETCYTRDYCTGNTICEKSPKEKYDCDAEWVKCGRWVMSPDFEFGVNPCDEA